MPPVVGTPLARDFHPGGVAAKLGVEVERQHQMQWRGLGFDERRAGLHAAQLEVSVVVRPYIDAEVVPLLKAVTNFMSDQFFRLGRSRSKNRQHRRQLTGKGYRV